MMKKMVENIDRRLEVEEEIDTMITSKRLEQNIMSAMPFVIILYLRVCNPGYMDALYGNALGIAAMSACLVITAATVIWGRKITDIHM
jgi:tight adherence protein B